MRVATDDLTGSTEQSEHRCCCLQHSQTKQLMTMHLLHCLADCMHKPALWIILRGICWTDMYPIQEGGCFDEAKATAVQSLHAMLAAQ